MSFLIVDHDNFEALLVHRNDFSMILNCHVLSSLYRVEVGSVNGPQFSVCGWASLAGYGSPMRNQGGGRTGCGETETVRGNQNGAGIVCPWMKPQVRADYAKASS